MPSPRRRPKVRSDELPVAEKMKMLIGALDPDRTADLWRRHGAQVLREDAHASGYPDMVEAYGPPPGWTVQDERERRARRAEIEAALDRRRRQFREQEGAP